MSTHQYETINFGKYKGRAWEDIPDSYLNWVIKNGDPDKAGTQIAIDEMQMRADEGRSVLDEVETAPQQAKRESVKKQHNLSPAGTPINKWCEEMEVRMNRLEAAVFPKKEEKPKTQGQKFVDDESDDLPF